MKSRVSIERLVADCSVARDCANHCRVQKRLDDLAERSLPIALGAALELPVGDGVWLIDRLTLDLDVDLAAPPARLAEAWARGIAAAVARAIEDDAVVRFTDRAAFLARFAVDLAAGVAFGKWYYRRFDGLEALPVSAALRTALIDDAPVGLDALLALPPPERARVIARLSHTDAERVLAALAATGEAPVERAFDALIAILAADESWFSDRGDARDALELYLCAVARSSEAAGRALRTWVERAAALDRRIGRPRDSAAEPLDSLEAQPPLEAILRARRRRRLQGEARKRRYTLFGGLFMLLPLLDELGRDLAEGPAPPESDALALGRFVTLLHVVGPARRQALFRDPLWRDLMGIAPDVAEAELPESSSGGADSVFARAAVELMRRFAQRLPGFAASSPASLYENFLDARASLEVDGERRVVRLGRPPIHAVLAMTRMPRARFSVSWLEGHFELYGEE
jgi:hypothetical protein